MICLAFSGHPDIGGDDMVRRFFLRLLLDLIIIALAVYGIGCLIVKFLGGTESIKVIVERIWGWLLSYGS